MLKGHAFGLKKLKIGCIADGLVFIIFDDIRQYYPSGFIAPKT